MYKPENIHQLESWLISKVVNIAQWGTGAAKSVQDLWNEIASGESQLEDNPPQRVVEVVDVIVRAGNRILMEGKQQFSDGRQRYRGIPLSEKIKPGESHVDAAIRGLKEELQVNSSDVKVLEASLQPQLILEESQSYPGLRTKYVVHKVEVEVDNLPGQDFWTYESQSNHDDVVKRHQWHWVAKDL